MAGFSFDILYAQEALKDFRRDLDKIDMENVTRRTGEEFADKVVDAITASIKAEDDIISPSALNSPYGRGDKNGGHGPPMVQSAAWIVDSNSDGSFSISPHPDVRQRAMVLNYGYPGRIYPRGDGPLRFYVDGDPVFAEWVEGPDPTHYWEQAMKIIESSGELENIAEDMLEFEVDEAFK